MSSQVALDGLEAQIVPRFIVGIDLGTTNCAVAYIDTTTSKRKPGVFMIPQLVDWQTVEQRTTLPSFHYQWTEMEASQLRSLPPSEFGRHNHCVGVFARNRGLQSPGRQISSAKSWLCHSGVDRTASILPWHGDPDAERLSPVVASSRYLEHIRVAWDAAHPQHPLASCEVVVTLPASFDEVARELTIEAARLSGLPRIILIEEPQAAFYAWLSTHEHKWHETILPGQTVLICDIGGGTTDFTLIRVREEHCQAHAVSTHDMSLPDAMNRFNQEMLDDNRRQYGLHRVAVGEHLMLGGDNFDLALAKAVEPLFLHSLRPAEFELLRQQCRVAKETLLGSHEPSHFMISVSAKGSRFIENVRSAEVSREFAERTLLDGFFPTVELGSIPQESESGFFEFGLPFAADPAITRHLAQFLWEHRWDGRPDESKMTMSDRLAARPDWILFNGGVLESIQIRRRLIRQLENWFSAADDTTANWHIGELDARQLDLAVALGAAYFGLVRRGDGVRIDARLARAYYLQVSHDPPRAICIMPGDAIPLARFVLADHPFELEIGRPIQFPIYVSSTQLIHHAGEIVPMDLAHMRPLPAIQTVLESSRHKRSAIVPIVLETELTEIGTLDLSLAAVGIDRQSPSEKRESMRWKLAFDLRSTVETDRVAHSGRLEQSGIVESELMDKATDVIHATFQPESPVDAAKNLVKNLANTLGVTRFAWKPSLLRSMWQTLIDIDPYQKRNSVMESRWLNLLGFCLRPGYGYAADDWRVGVTWRMVQGKLKHPSNAAEVMVLWRRIAGGFTSGQQRALHQEIQGRVREVIQGSVRSISSNQESMELLRLVGSLELLEPRDKQLMGNQAISAIHRSKLAPLQDSILWMLGRLGARSLVYGPLNHVVQADIVADWVRSLCQIDNARPSHHLALMQLTRKTGDRYRDLPTDSRELSIRTLERWSAPESYVQLVRVVSELDTSENETIIGESLPLGIRLRC